MATTLTRVLLHVTFSTRERAPLIGAEIEGDLFAYTGGICPRFESPLLAMGGSDDHVHLCISLSKNVAIASLMMELKRDTSKWMKQHTSNFAWQDGYFAWSIGESGLPALRRYITGQRAHHERRSFQDELRGICAKYGLEVDERYAWK